MRFMVMVKMNEPSPPPSSELIAEMGAYNQKLIDAGVLLAGEGLRESAKGAKVTMKNGKLVITDGPFAEAKELVGGFWIIKAKDKEEALDWVRKIPFTEGGEIELRQVTELTDFRPDEISGPALEQQKAWRDEGKWPTNR